MKNLKKVLALVLAFAMAFTMFAGAVDFSDVKPGDDYSAAISMLSDLEVISGNGKGQYEPAKAVTRAEACVLIANMMNGGKADTARFAGGSNFSDVAKSFWGESAIAYCVQNGITYGVGGGKFAPAREITDAEFVAMMTRAMGYDTAANPLSFPYGNYTAAVNNGLLENIPYAEGSACTKGECAQIIYDALFADYARLTANLNVVHGADDHDTCTLIEDVFGLTRANNSTTGRGAQKCTSHYFVVVDADNCVEENVIMAAPISDRGVVDTDLVDFECDVDVSALVGYKVILWGEEAHANRTTANAWNIDTVKAVEIVEGQTAYEFTPDMDLDDLDIEAEENVYGYQGNINEKNGNSYVLIDWNNDKDYDFVVATIREYFEVDAITSKKVKLDGEFDIELELDGETENAGFDGHDVVCEIPEDIAAGDIVEIEYDWCAYEETATWTMSIVEPETKDVTEVASKGHKVYFDDEYLQCAEYNFGAEAIYDELDDDDEDDYAWDVWQDANGFILKLAEPSESYAGYLLVIGQDDGSSATGNRHNAELDVVYDNGEAAEDVKVAKDATIVLGEDEVSAYDDDARDIEGSIVGKVFKYQKSGDEITKLVQVAYTLGNNFVYDSDAEMMKVNNGRYWMDDTDVVFVIKSAENINTAYGVSEAEQIDADDVKVVEYTALPSIGTGYDTDDRGIGYTEKANTKDSLNKAVVLGVDTFKFFDDVDVTVALVTDVTYKPNTDKWTVKAIVPGKGLTTFTAEEGDLAVGTVDALSDADSDLNTLEMIWAELEYTDDVLSAFALAADKNSGNIDEETTDYTIARAAISHYTAASDKVSFVKLHATGDATVEEKLSTSVFGTYDITDATEFFVIDDDGDSVPVMPALGKKLATFDGYTVDAVDEIAFSTAINSYLDDDNTDENEYQMADVVLNSDGEIVMIFFFEELVQGEAYEAVDAYVVEAKNTNDTSDSKIGLRLAITTTNELTGEVDAVPVKLNSIDDVAVEVKVERQQVIDASTENPTDWVVVNVELGDVAPVDGTAWYWYTAELNGVEDGDRVTVTINGIEAESFIFEMVEPN